MFDLAVKIDLEHSGTSGGITTSDLLKNCLVHSFHFPFMETDQLSDNSGRATCFFTHLEQYNVRQKNDGAVPAAIFYYTEYRDYSELVA